MTELDELRRDVGQLSLLNDIAVALGSAKDLDAAVHTLVSRSVDAIGAEQGVVTLVGRASGDAAATFVRTVRDARGSDLRPDEALMAWMDANRRTLRLADPRAEAPFSGFQWGESVRSVLCAPLISAGRFLGVLTLYNKRATAASLEAQPAGASGVAFTPEDGRLLTILAMQSAQTLDAAQKATEHTRILNIFGRHTAPAVVEELLRYDADPPGRRTHACIMFLDVRGFTTFAEQAEPEAVVTFLNRFFGLTIDAVTSRGGIVHQLLGDGFMAVFGAPLATPDDCTRAVEAALDIVARVEAEVASGELQPVRVGIGLHAGEVIAGTVGSAQHKEYKVTGDVVNVAARVEGLNKTYDSQVLVTDAVWARVPPGQFAAEPLGRVDLRGRSVAPEIHRLV